MQKRSMAINWAIQKIVDIHENSLNNFEIDELWWLIIEEVIAQLSKVLVPESLNNIKEKTASSLNKLFNNYSEMKNNTCILKEEYKSLTVKRWVVMSKRRIIREYALETIINRIARKHLTSERSNLFSLWLSWKSSVNTLRIT